ncbi:hypothetical protein CHU_2187 [Cytophaga hutchinsonii ATCC 33406]|uniref:Uncharacterized protein n=2 Tax=Cytophaga hutchinsonii TaxID=985 RepID=A0A6N4STB1_CYTH3|nr:hypothetical protein CHU_2187 [Cytophaga hutchinsonii ATCC 33406]SFX96348.1 hypothetical protein SAMN04487930_11518 [Cytophaga hutchinsonii ATCC 33406]
MKKHVLLIKEVLVLNSVNRIIMNRLGKIVFGLGIAVCLFSATNSIAQVKTHSSLRAENLEVILVKDIQHISDTTHHTHAHDPHKSSYKILHVNFMLVSSDPSVTGYKSVMMRLIDPHGVDIYDPAAGGGLFNLNGKETPYTFKVSTKLDGQPLKIDFLYNHPKHFRHGLHIIELYVDGLKIGEEHFVIK